MSISASYSRGATRANAIANRKKTTTILRYATSPTAPPESVWARASTALGMTLEAGAYYQTMFATCDLVVLVRTAVIATRQRDPGSVSATRSVKSASPKRRPGGVTRGYHAEPYALPGEQVPRPAVGLGQLREAGQCEGAARGARAA